MLEPRENHTPAEFWTKRRARTTNLTGVVVNEFEVTGYVGNDWRTSQYAKFKHRPCGAEGTVLAGEARFRLGKRKCKCRKAGKQ